MQCKEGCAPKRCGWNCMNIDLEFASKEDIDEALLEYDKHVLETTCESLCYVI